MKNYTLDIFPGYYETLLGVALASYMEKNDCTFQIGAEAIAREYVGSYNRICKGCIIFDKIISPKEYNYTTDTLYVRGDRGVETDETNEDIFYDILERLDLPFMDV